MKILTSKTPSLDLHGEIASMVEVLVDTFINEQIKLNQELLRIIHGKSTNILTNEVHFVLRKNKNVKKFYLNNWNLGETIVELELPKR